jgi:glucokinase
MVRAAVGIDIGGTYTKFGLVEENGNVVAESSIPTNSHNDVKEYVINLSKEIKKLSGKEIEISGIGIGVPNGNYYNGTVEFAPNLPWKGVIKFAELFKEQFKLPVVLTNDANAAAIGEMMYGAAKGMKDFILITLGTGLGSGFVANGEMIYGHDGFAGELGHTFAVYGGRLCGCGRRGCLEQYASATGIVKTVIEMLEDTNKESMLREYKNESISSKLIYEAAKAGDKLALEAFDYTARILGISLADAVAITSPEAIIFFGGLSLAGDYIIVPTKKYMEENMLNVFKNKVKLIPSALMGKNAAVLGASALVWKETK